MKRAILLLSTLAATPTVAAAEPHEHVRIDYMLPATVVTAGVQQRITKCPASAETQADTAKAGAPLQAEFTWKTALVAKQTPNRLVSLDTETGFLVDRETKVHFADDWYLKDFNGKTTGQGGALAVSLVKGGAAILAMSVNPIVGVGVAGGLAATKANTAYFAKGNILVLDTLPPAAPPVVLKATHWYIVCKESVEEDLAHLAEARSDVAKLEARVVGGDLSAPTQDLLTLRRSQAAEFEAKLTITAIADKPLKPTRGTDGSYSGVSARIGSVDISPWFRLVSVTRPVLRQEDVREEPKPTNLRAILDRQKLPGTFGYQVTITVDKTLASVFGCEGAGTPAAVNDCWADMNAGAAKRTRDLIYTRPIPASAKIYPFAAPCANGAICDPVKDWQEGEKATGTLPIKLPQLSRLYSMRTGGSIFGGRTVGAEFGTMGEPTMLQYNIGSSGKDAAGLLDASVSAAQTARDADNAAIKRRLDATKNRQDLEALLEEQAAQPTP